MGDDVTGGPQGETPTDGGSGPAGKGRGPATGRAEKGRADEAPPRKRSSRKAGSKKAGSKKAPSKKAPSKKAPSRKAGSKKAPSKEAPSRKAPVTKADSKKAPSKGATPTKGLAAASGSSSAAKRSRVVRIDPDQPGTADARAQSLPESQAVRGIPSPGRATPPSGRPSGDRRRWAICASVTEEMLNDLVFFGLREGVVLDPVEQQVNLPGLGEATMSLGLVITGVRFELRGEDAGRARVTVLGSGDVGVSVSDYEGDQLEADPGFPTMPAPLPVALTALAEPFLELRDDRTVSVGLDLRNAELLELGVDLDAGAPEGIDAQTWAGLLQVTATLFSIMGESLFDGLADAISSVGMDLGEDIGTLLADLGVDHGPADAQVSSGVLSFGLPAQVEVEGRAMPVPVAGKRLGVAVARSGVDRVAADLIERAIGGMPLPFELEIDLGEQKIGGRLRQPRLISERFPDLRSAVRTEVGVRLVRGRMEIAVSAAWLELPSFVPGFVNTLNRRIGGLLSMAPLRFRFPATIELPIVPGSDEALAVRVDDLRVTTDGVGVVVALA